jgi:hypothetical protein
MVVAVVVVVVVALSMVVAVAVAVALHQCLINGFKTAINPWSSLGT